MLYCNTERAGLRRLSTSESKVEEKRRSGHSSQTAPSSRGATAAVENLSDSDCSSNEGDEGGQKEGEEEREKKSGDRKDHETTLFSPLIGDSRSLEAESRPEGGRFNVAAALVVHSGWFYKKGSLHKAWQLR